MKPSQQKNEPSLTDSMPATEPDTVKAEDTQQSDDKNAGTLPPLSKITAQELLNLLAEEAEVVRKLSKKKHDRLSQCPVTDGTRREQSGATWQNRLETQGRVNGSIAALTGEEEYLLCLLTRRVLAPGDEHIDHAYAAHNIKESSLRLATWLQSSHNKGLAQDILALEIEKKYGYFMKDLDKGNHIAATQRLLNHYYNDVNNLSILCPSANLSKSKNDFYDLLYKDTLFGEEFRQAVAENNRQIEAVGAIGLIVNKVGGEPGWILHDDQGDQIVVSKNGIGLAKFARDWFMEKHELRIKFGGKWQEITNNLDKIYEARHAKGQSSGRLLSLCPLLEQVIGIAMDQGLSPNSSPSRSDDPPIDKTGKMIEDVLIVLEDKEALVREIALVVHRNNLIKVVSATMKDYKVSDGLEDKRFQDTETYQSFVKALRTIENTAFLKKFWFEANAIRTESFDYDGAERATYFWNDFKKLIIPEVEKTAYEIPESLRNFQAFEKERSALLIRLEAAEQRAEKERQRAEKEKRVREIIEEKAKKLEEKLKKKRKITKDSRDKLAPESKQYGFFKASISKDEEQIDQSKFHQPPKLDSPR